MIARRTLGLMLGAFFAAPYFFSLMVSHFHLRVPDDFVPLILHATLQAALSALAAMALGWLGTLALLRRSPRWELVALAPSVAPAIAMVLGFVTVFPQWRGLSAVVAAHALSSAGLIAVVLTRQIRTTIGASLELAWTEGATRGQMWRNGVFPALRADAVRLGLSVFAASLSSFSIPLLLGGSKAVTVEIGIHHAIRFENAWDVAATLSLFQWAMLVAFVIFLHPPRVERKSETILRAEVGRILVSTFESYLGVVALAIAPTLVIYALSRGPIQGFAQLRSTGFFESWDVLTLALRGSFVTGTFAGMFSALLLYAFAMVYPSERVRVWMSGYIAPSVAITGFATLVIGWGANPSFILDSLRISVGAAFLFAPVLWRLRWEQNLAQLEGQVKVAQTLGASHGLIIRRVLTPQLREVIFWSAGLVSFWVWGDYALGSIAASRAMTMALLAKSLLESYRLEAASLLILGGLVLGGCSYRLLSWGGASRVAR